MNGHWYCSFEAEIKFFPRPADTETAEEGMICPDCRNRSLAWVPDSPARLHIFPRRTVSPEMARSEFEKIRAAINAEGGK